MHPWFDIRVQQLEEDDRHVEIRNPGTLQENLIN